MKRTNDNRLLNFLKNLKPKALHRFKLLVLSQSNLRTFLQTFGKANALSLGRTERLKERVRVTHNFIVFLLKFRKNHGDEFVIKWLKSSTVALQKYLGRDPIKSLRDLEPNIPLPRLINGCPAYINKSDRFHMRQGNQWICRYWLTQLNFYRILLGPMKSKVNSIYDPFKGCMDSLLDLILVASGPSNPFKRLPGFDKIKFRTPMGLILSHSSSPSNSHSFSGLVSDLYLLKIKEITPEWNNILKYFEILEKGGFQTRRIRSILRNLESLYYISKEEGLKLPFKKSMSGTGLSQFAIKEEAAGKVRVFALIDSITQSILSPLHDYLFSILKIIPNDGTFDQDESVKRSANKFKTYGVAYSFDLSSATDRLPARLTAQILESLVNIKGFGDAWLNLMVDRDFNFSTSVKKKYPHLLEDQGNRYRYSVGQPMGGLSSWAGLAISHHWILQYCSGSQVWDERYEVLGDDIVIFDKCLADSYLKVMEDLGVDINISKSISNSSLGFEFAKRTVMNGIDISPVSLREVIVSKGISSRVSLAFSYLKRGLIRSSSLLAATLSKVGSPKSLRNIKDIGLPALNLLSLLNSSNLIERRVVIESLVNPNYMDFDWEKAKFDLPLRSLLKYIVDVLNGQGGYYPFSKESDRNEFFNEIEPFLVDAILQEALSKMKLLCKDLDQLLVKGSSSLFRGQPSKLFKAQLAGFWQDLIIGFSNYDYLSNAEDVEDKLYFHAKSRRVTVDEALKILEDVEGQVFKFTFKTQVSRIKYDKVTSPVLESIRKSQGLVPMSYWHHGLDSL
uniref:RNA-dependent RNA polymerase n=1 Tax=Nigrospora oryzae mitovirus 1 TaxID=2497444 RepID=A0A9E9C0T5_9VIRU|nr:MAG: RNA-dependent RNA polymerase [Nigrospora oryzae mitovirus 1]